MQAATQFRCHGPTCLWQLLALVATLVLSTGHGLAQDSSQSEYAVFQLRHARTDEVESPLREVLDGLPDGAEVVADQRANRILVRGSAEARRVATQLVQSLDRPAAERQPSDRVLKTYPVAGDELDATIARLKQKFPAKSGARIAADSRSEQILVLAEPAVHERIARFLADGAVPHDDSNRAPQSRPTARTGAARAGTARAGTAQEGDEATFVQLQHTRWEQMEAKLKQLWGNRLATGKSTPDHRRYRLQFEESGQVQFDADLESGAVTVWGDEVLQKRCARVIRALDQSRRSAGRRSEVVPLVHAQPAKIERLAAAVQQPNPSSAEKTDRPDAEQRKRPLIARMFQKRPSLEDENDQKDPASDADAADGEKGDEEDAGEGNTTDDETSDDEMTTEQGPTARPRRPDRAAPQADANQRPAEAGAGDQDRPDGEEGAQGLIGPVQIEYLDGLDVIIVSGNDRDVERVLKMIEEIEKLSVQTVPSVVLHPLKHVGSEALATIVTQLYDQVLSPRQGRVSITPLSKPNALLLIGRDESVKTVVDLVKQLDQPVGPSGQFEVFRLRYASAAATRATIQEFFANRTGLGTRVLATIDFRSNSLIVQASPRDLAEVGRLVQRLDTPTSAAVNELRVIKLQRSLAEELAPILQEAINSQTGTGQRGGAGGAGGGGLQAALQGGPGAPGGGGAPGAPGGQGQQAGGVGQQQLLARSTMLRFVTLDPEGQRKLSSGILTDVKITADPRANSLLVSGPPDSMDLVEALVRELDRAPAAVSQIKVFTIVNGDATALVEMLQNLFGQQGAAGQNALFVAASEEEGSLVGLRFSVDVRTNSIMAAGSASDLNVVEAVLLRLDASDVRQRKSTVYKLKNSYSVEVANAINEFLRSERQVQQITPGILSPFEQIEREVVVVPEQVSNSLIVSATPRYFDEIRKIVEQLDARIPMVMIQVLIAEITLDNTDEFGVELGLQDSILFDRSLLGDLITTSTSTTFGNPPTTTQTQTIQSASWTPGYNFNNLPLGNSGSDVSLRSREHVAGQGLTNFSLGRLNSELGYGGLVLSASSDAVSMLVRALKECRRLDVLSRPQVMTLDNQPAFIQVGSRVPRVRGVQTNQTGQTSNVIDENVGLILAVTPRVTPDNLVVMEIDAEKSALGPEAEGVPISISATGDVVRQPVINTTTAQTTISATTGQTVVLGGLITKSRSSIQRRVPLLADVPVLGHLFRYDRITNKRTELLIILTPHVVRTEDDAQKIKQTEAARMSWCLADVRKLHGDIGPLGRFDEFSDVDTQVIYPDQNPGGLQLLPVPDQSDSNKLGPGQSGPQQFGPEQPIPVGPELGTPGPGGVVPESPDENKPLIKDSPVPDGAGAAIPGRVTPALYRSAVRPMREQGRGQGTSNMQYRTRGQEQGQRTSNIQPNSNFERQTPPVSGLGRQIPYRAAGPEQRRSNVKSPIGERGRGEGSLNAQLRTSNFQGQNPAQYPPVGGQ